MWFQYLYNTLLQTCGLYFLFYDIARGIGSSNGRFTSFAQSLESAYKYKAGHYDINNKTNKDERSTCKTILKYVYRCIISTFLKFGPGTIVSIALGLYPTWTKGPRHIYSYYIAFFVIQLLPRNNGFLFFYNSILSRILMHTATALYKLRKLSFILQASTNGIFIIEYFFLANNDSANTSNNNYFLGAVNTIVTQICIFTLALWECEGSTLCRKIELNISNTGDGYGNRCHRPFFNYLRMIFRTWYIYCINIPFVFKRCCSFVAVWVLYFSWKHKNVNIVDTNIGQNYLSDDVLPFRSKIISLVVLWFRYNIDDVLTIINYCHRKCCSSRRMKSKVD